MAKSISFDEFFDKVARYVPKDLQKYIEHCTYDCTGYTVMFNDSCVYKGVTAPWISARSLKALHEKCKDVRKAYFFDHK